MAHVEMVTCRKPTVTVGAATPRYNCLEATIERRNAWAEHPELGREVLGGLPRV